jgi:putative peptidoglycan lipid II flippase
MVERLFSKLSAPIRGLHQAAYVLAALTLASQVLALLRDRTFAAVFGAGHTLDLYYSAFRIPDLVFALVSSLISAYVLIPRIASGNQAENRELLSQAISFLLVVGGLICLVLGIFAPQLLSILYPSFTQSPSQAEFVLLVRLLLAQPVILGISGAIQSVTQVHRRFALFALSPVLYNLGIIAGTVVLYPHYGLPGIGIGVLLGACLHALIHVPVLTSAGVFPRLKIPSLRAMIPVVSDSIPRSLALGAGSFTVLALTALASRIGEGAVSVFTLAGNLELVPLSLIGASYAVAAFPALSEHSATNNREEFTRVLSASARHIILWSLIFLGLIIVLRAHLVRAILGAGAFDWNATRLTAALLAVLAVGLVAQGLVLLFSRALYAAQQSWRPFLYQAGGAVATVLLALFFLNLGATDHVLASLSGLFRVGDVHGTLILMVALAATLGQILLAFASFAALRPFAPGLGRSLIRPFVHGGCAALMGGVATYATLFLEGGIAPLTTLFAVFTQGLVAGIVGAAASGIALALLRNEEFSDIITALRKLIEARRAHEPVLAPSAPEETELS